MEHRILSIQSHVVFGYVGNKCAVFPLQLLGFDVDAINSVQLSNHTGYQVAKGHVLNENDLDCIMGGLSTNGLDVYSHLLTGYVSNVSFLKQIIKVVEHLKSINPQLIYVCDPVLGDDGKLYVPEELISIYRDHIIPLADIIVPNKYEMEWLTDTKITNIDDVLVGMNYFHNKGCRVVVVTSVEFTEGCLTCIASLKYGNMVKRAAVDVEKIQCQLYGTGDLFGALFLAWMAKTDNDIVVALQTTVSTIYAIVYKTFAYKQSSAENTTSKCKELKLVQCKDDIENPKIIFKAREIR